MIAALAFACVVLNGCTSASGVNIESLSPSTSTSKASSTTAADSASSALQSSARQTSAAASPGPTAANHPALPAAEAADRAAVESQWVKSWDVYLAIATTPAADRRALIATVAVDPARAKMLSDAGKFDAQGLKTYGTLGHRISWPQPINGRKTALIDDCQDRSRAGALKTSNGDKITVGVPRDHYQGNLVKGTDGIWRVAEVYYLKDEPC